MMTTTNTFKMGLYLLPVLAAMTACGPETEFDTSSSAAVRPAASSVMFTTSTLFRGSLASFGGGTGIEFADAECQRRADAQGIGGQFKAVLCDASTHAKRRLKASITYPVVNVAGEVLEQTNLWDGTVLEGQILQDDGAPRTPSWSGCTSVGRASRYNCRNWTYFLSSDRGVTSWDSAAYWLGNNGRGTVCNRAQSLLCVQTGD